MENIKYTNEYIRSLFQSDEYGEISFEIVTSDAFYLAVRCVVYKKRASTSALQRLLSIGYGRAAEDGVGVGFGDRGEQGGKSLSVTVVSLADAVGDRITRAPPVGSCHKLFAKEGVMLIVADQIAKQEMIAEIRRSIGKKRRNTVGKALDTFV